MWNILNSLKNFHFFCSSGKWKLRWNNKDGKRIYCPSNLYFHFQGLLHSLSSNFGCFFFFLTLYIIIDIPDKMSRSSVVIACLWQWLICLQRNFKISIKDDCRIAYIWKLETLVCVLRHTFLFVSFCRWSSNAQRSLYRSHCFKESKLNSRNIILCPPSVSKNFMKKVVFQISCVTETKKYLMCNGS